MEQPLADTDVAEADLKTWETRFGEWKEDQGAGQLGQHNFDDTSTRTKITHIEGAGYGLIGRVLALAYGSWSKQPAALLVMEFSFRAGKGSLRYKDAEISISFEPRTVSSGKTPNATAPVVSSWYPKNNRISKRQTANAGSGLNHIPTAAWDPTLDSSQPAEQSMWPAEEFWIRGRQWSRKHRQEPHEVIWNVTEIKGSTTGISEEIRLAVIVTHSGSFRAVVGVKATIGFGLPVKNFPWSQDDPLLFDGTTPKGACPSTSDFNAITNQDLLIYLSDSNLSAMNVPQTRDGPSSHQKISSKQSTVATNVDSRSRRVYRVRGIPLLWSQLSFTEILSTSMKVKKDFVRVHSFAENPYRTEKMAVVSFEEIQGGVLIPHNKLEWLLYARLSNKGATAEQTDEELVELLFDTHFLGFSELGLLPTNPSPHITE
jgi:protein SERAC1